MAEDVINYVTRLEERIRLLEGSIHSVSSPSWQDVSALDQKLKESHSEITTLKVQLAEQRITKAEISEMINIANRAQSKAIGNSIADFVHGKEFKASVTEDFAGEIRSEVKASLGSASGAATAAKAVARATIDNAIQTLRSRSHFWARG